jgi:hypothetical protein
LLLHRRHHVGRAQVYLFARRRAAGDQVRAHKLAEITPQESAAIPIMAQSVFRMPWK